MFHTTLLPLIIICLTRLRNSPDAPTSVYICMKRRNYRRISSSTSHVEIVGSAGKSRRRRKADLIRFIIITLVSPLRLSPWLIFIPIITQPRYISIYIRVRFQILPAAHSLENERLEEDGSGKENARGWNERDNVENNYSRGKFKDYEGNDDRTRARPEIYSDFETGRSRLRCIISLSCGCARCDSPSIPLLSLSAVSLAFALYVWTFKDIISSEDLPPDMTSISRDRICFLLPCVVLPFPPFFTIEQFMFPRSTGFYFSCGLP